MTTILQTPVLIADSETKWVIRGEPGHPQLRICDGKTPHLSVLSIWSDEDALRNLKAAIEEYLG